MCLPTARLGLCISQCLVSRSLYHAAYEATHAVMSYVMSITDLMVTSYQSTCGAHGLAVQQFHGTHHCQLKAVQCIAAQCMIAMHDSMLTCCWRLLRPTQRGWAATLQPLHLIRPDPCLHSRHLDLAFSPMSFTKPQKSCHNRNNTKFGLWPQRIY